MNTEVPAGSVECAASPTDEDMSLPRLLRGGSALSAGLQNRTMRSFSGAASARHLRVLVDMDGVLADFEGGFVKKYRRRYPQEPYITLEDRRGFWVSDQYENLKPGLSEKAISIWESKNFFLELDPIDGAVEALKEMSRLPNTDVFICTSPIKRYQYCPYEKYAWVEKHFGHEFLEQIILTRDKTIVSADLLIDDRPDITGAEATPSWEHILFTACHNRHLATPSPPRRLQSWRDDWKALLNLKRSQLSEGFKSRSEMKA